MVRPRLAVATSVPRPDGEEAGTLCLRQTAGGMPSRKRILWREEEMPMARIPYVDPPPDGADDPNGLRGLYAQIEATRGSVLNLYRALANQPAALRAYFALSRYVRDDSSLDPRLRELAIVGTAYALDVEYERFHHIPAARRAGVREDQLAAFPDWRAASADTFDADERAVLAYSDEVARSRTVSSTTLDALARRLPRGALLDLVLTVAFYHLCAALVLPLGIEPEERDGRRTGAVPSPDRTAP